MSASILIQIVSINESSPIHSRLNFRSRCEWKKTATIIVHFHYRAKECRKFSLKERELIKIQTKRKEKEKAKAKAKTEANEDKTETNERVNKRRKC